MFTVLACAAALGHHWCAGLLNRWGARRALSRASLLAAIGAVLMARPGTPLGLGVAVAIFGIGVGVAMTAAYTTAGGALPDAARATGFGFLTSASLIGMAASPMVSGLIAHAGIRVVFYVNAVMLVVFGSGGAPRDGGADAGDDRPGDGGRLVDVLLLVFPFAPGPPRLVFVLPARLAWQRHARQSR